MKKLAKILGQAGIENITCKLYAGGRHEMFNERNKQRVYNDLLAWIDARV